MTEPIEEALDAWAKVFETALGFAAAHAQSHLAPSVSKGTGKKPGPSSFQMSTDIHCEPAPKAKGSTVTINVPAPPDDLAIGHPKVVRVVAGSMPVPTAAGGQFAVLGTGAVILAGDTTLVLQLPQLAQGLHVGHVTTANGAKIAPIVLYVDDALT